MINLSDCILLGTIVKLHGFRGQVVLRLNIIASDKIKEMELVLIEIDGLPVPFFISEYSVRSPESILLNLEDIHNKDKAKELINARVFVRSDTINAIPDQLPDENQLIGYEVIDNKAGSLGILKDIIDIHQNPLFLVLKGRKEILIPAYQEFILEIDTSNKIILVEVPEGLTELP